MESGLVGRAVVVTGAGRGIGKEVAREVARLGGLVVVNDIDEAAAAATAQEIGGDGKAVAHAADVADAAAAEALVQRCVAEFGRIDGLVNNAALMAVGDLVEHDAALLRRVLEVNVVGVANCAAAA
jgi:NAD(P)-dependent dehydrogenase (short-subunit alcohol dehydrogenase family)